MCCPRTLLYRPNVRLRYFSLARLLEASKLWAWFIHSDWHRTPAPARDRLLWMAVSIIIHIYTRARNEHNKSRHEICWLVKTC